MPTRSDDPRLDPASQRAPSPPSAAVAEASHAPAQPRPAGVVARAALASARLGPADVLRLQRTIGNQATGRVLASLRPSPTGSPAQGRGAVQRTIAEPYDGTLYVGSPWLDRNFDDRDETVREVALSDGSDLKNELLANLEVGTGVAIASVVEVKAPSEMLAKLTEKSYVLHGPNAKARRIRLLKARLRDAVADVSTVTVLPPEADTAQTGANVLDPASLRSKPTLLPHHLVKAPDDLAGGYDIAKVCALIALVKAEPRAALNLKLNRVGNLGSDQAYYQALHTLYYTTKHVQYDEPSTHPPLYTEWGYTMVFSGGSSFRNLPNVLRTPLVTGKKYIVSIRGHVVYVTMRKALQPGVAMGEKEVLSDYFEYHSDPANYNVSHDRDVDYIFEK
jgi:hypothetical protein